MDGLNDFLREPLTSEKIILTLSRQTVSKQST